MSIKDTISATRKASIYDAPPIPKLRAADTRFATNYTAPVTDVVPVTPSKDFESFTKSLNLGVQAFEKIGNIKYRDESRAQAKADRATNLQRRDEADARRVKNERETKDRKHANLGLIEADTEVQAIVAAFKTNGTAPADLDGNVLIETLRGNKRIAEIRANLAPGELKRFDLTLKNRYGVIQKNIDVAASLARDKQVAQAMKAEAVLSLSEIVDEGTRDIAQGSLTGWVETLVGDGLSEAEAVLVAQAEILRSVTVDNYKQLQKLTINGKPLDKTFKDTIMRRGTTNTLKANAVAKEQLKQANQQHKDFGSSVLAGVSDVSTEYETALAGETKDADGNPLSNEKQNELVMGKRTEYLQSLDSGIDDITTRLDNPELSQDAVTTLTTQREYLVKRRTALKTKQTVNLPYSKIVDEMVGGATSLEKINEIQDYVLDMSTKGYAVQPGVQTKLNNLQKAENRYILEEAKTYDAHKYGVIPTLVKQNPSLAGYVTTAKEKITFAGGGSIEPGATILNTGGAKVFELWKQGRVDNPTGALAPWDDKSAEDFISFAEKHKLSAQASVDKTLTLGTPGALKHLTAGGADYHTALGRLSATDKQQAIMTLPPEQQEDALKIQTALEGTGTAAVTTVLKPGYIDESTGEYVPPVTEETPIKKIRKGMTPEDIERVIPKQELPKTYSHVDYNKRTYNQDTLNKISDTFYNADKPLAEQSYFSVTAFEREGKSFYRDGGRFISGSEDDSKGMRVVSGPIDTSANILLVVGEGWDSTAIPIIRNIYDKTKIISVNVGEFLTSDKEFNYKGKPVTFKQVAVFGPASQVDGETLNSLQKRFDIKE